MLRLDDRNIPNEPKEAILFYKNRLDWLAIRVDTTKKISLKLFYSREAFRTKQIINRLENSLKELS